VAVEVIKPDLAKIALLNLDQANGIARDQSMGMIAAAQAYATLALVEQVKRIADQMGAP
jgi:hypothetical protein